MLTIKPVKMSLLGENWFSVEDEEKNHLGAFPTEAGAMAYRNRLKERGINCAEDLIAKGATPRHREAMRFLMATEARA